MLFQFLLVELIDFNAETTLPSGQVVSAGWYDIQEGSAISEYTLQSIVEEGVPEPIAKLLYEELNACSGCRPSFRHPWTFGAFDDVPQLGSEPVQGSGCNVSGEIVPDGWWFGSYDVISNGYVDFDIVCPYIGAKAKELFDTCQLREDLPEMCYNWGSEDLWVVNANPRKRKIPLSDNYLIEPSEDSTEEPWDSSAFHLGAKWILVQGGKLVYVKQQMGYN